MEWGGKAKEGGKVGWGEERAIRVYGNVGVELLIRVLEGGGTDMSG